MDLIRSIWDVGASVSGERIVQQAGIFIYTKLVLLYGTVAYAAPFTGYGVMVILDHGQNAFTVYGHLAGSALRPGMAVTRVPAFVR